VPADLDPVEAATVAEGKAVAVAVAVAAKVAPTEAARPEAAQRNLARAASSPVRQ
jgi:hypothetical protein